MSYFIAGMATAGPDDFGLPCFIEMRPKPDAAHKEPTIKVRLWDSQFKEDKQNTTVVSVLTGKVLAGPALPTKVHRALIRWFQLEGNAGHLALYWEANSSGFTTAMLFRLLQPLKDSK